LDYIIVGFPYASPPLIAVLHQYDSYLNVSKSRITS